MEYFHPEYEKEHKRKKIERINNYIIITELQNRLYERGCSEMTNYFFPHILRPFVGLVQLISAFVLF